MKKAVLAVSVMALALIGYGAGCRRVEPQVQNAPNADATAAQPTAQAAPASPATPAAPVAPAPATTAPPAPAGAQAAKDFSLKDLSGKTVKLSDYRGKSNVFIHFGTTWCPPCIAEIPALNEMHGKYRADELVIVYVDINEDANTVRNFVRNRSVQYLTLLDEDGAVSQEYKVVAVPLNILVDKDGLIRAQANAIPENAIKTLVGR